MLLLKQVIGIRDVIPPPLRREFSDVYIATELMDTDLHQIIRSNQGLSEEHCQVILFALFLRATLPPPLFFCAFGRTATYFSIGIFFSISCIRYSGD